MGRRGLKFKEGAGEQAKADLAKLFEQPTRKEVATQTYQDDRSATVPPTNRAIRLQKKTTKINPVDFSGSDRTAKVAQKKEESDSSLPIVLFSIVTAIVIAAFYLPTQKTSMPLAPVTATKLSAQDLKIQQERIEFYRHEVGSRLNRDRIETEYENMSEAPSLDAAHSTRVGAPDVMQGIPIAGEKSSRMGSRENGTDHLRPEAPGAPDTQVMSTLQQEQDQQREAKISDRATRDAAVADIVDVIESAKRQGYAIHIDENGNIINDGRIPASKTGNSTAR